MSSLALQVGASSDDARNLDPNGAASITVVTQHLGKFNTTDKYWNGFRFTGVTIPQGATINSATFDLYSAQVTSGTTAKVIYYGNAIDNAVTFDTSAETPQAKARTTATVTKDYTVASWTATAGFGVETVDLAGVVQEVINRAGWSSGNSLIIIGYDNGSANSSYIGHSTYDRATDRGAKLTIDYTSGASTLSVNVSDSVTLTESVGRLLESNVNVSDSSTLSESLTMLLSALPNLTDNITISESSTSYSNLILTRESYNVQILAPTGDLAVTVSDSITITELVARMLESYISASDSATITELVVKLLESGINKSESATISESLGELLESNISKSDTSTITELVVTNPESRVNVSDSATVTESTKQLLESSIVVSDSATLTESVGRLLESNITKSESVTLTESLTVFIPTLNLQVSDTATITEAISVSRVNANDLSLNISDNVIISESLALLLQGFINKSDSITFTENLLRLIEANVNKSESATVTESIGKLLESNIRVSDAATITESTTLLIPTLSINVSESATITEAITVSNSSTHRKRLLTLLGVG